MTVAGDDLLVVMRATAPVANMTATSKWWGLALPHSVVSPIRLLVIMCDTVPTASVTAIIRRRGSGICR